MLDIMYIYICISKYVYVYFEGLDKKPRDADILCPDTHGRRRAKLTQRFEQRRLVCSFSRNRAPISRTRGWKSSPGFRQNLSAGNRCPIWGRSWGESSLQPFGCKLVRLQLGQISGGQHGHTSSFAAWPSPPGPRPDQIQNPKSKLQTARLDFGILDFGFWILDFGFWISDFGFWISDFGFWILDFGGFWILDFGFWILDFGFWISDFGFWISDFGFWIFGLLPTVWILHKISTSHADSGRRILGSLPRPRDVMTCTSPCLRYLGAG